MMAFAALWVLLVTLIIVALSKKTQNYFTRKQTAASVAVEDGVQECLDTVCDLKSNNAEKKYLQGLDNKIDYLEGRHVKSELGSAMFVVPSSMILKLGIASVAFVGGMLLINGTLSLITFFMFLLVVSRIYEPMTGALQNLAAMNSLQVNTDRINDMENTPELGGSEKFNPKGYLRLIMSDLRTIREKWYWTAYCLRQNRAKLQLLSEKAAAENLRLQNLPQGSGM